MPLAGPAKAAYERARRARKALEAGRVPGKTGRPATGRKAPKSHGDRRGQRLRARQREQQQNGDNGWTESKHPLMDEAAAITQRHIKPDRRTHYLDPLYEEALMTAALALLDGRDADQAVVSCLKTERNHRYHTIPLEGPLMETL